MKEFEYKVGDYVYCYNDIKTSDIKFSRPGFIFKKGNLYRIKKIEIVDPMLIIHIETEIDFILGYYLDKFYNHFLSKIEYRKLKFKKLNEKI